MNRKQKGFILLMVSLFGIITSSVLFVIGCFSSYLITGLLHRVVLTFLILLTILMVVSIVLIYKGRRRRLFKKWQIILPIVLISLYGIGCSSFLFILYGPFTGFREWLITTAMRTMNHQYYCKWFYSDDMINEVLNSNYIIEVSEDTNPDLVNKDNNDDKLYKNDYEKAILKRDKDALYKIIHFEVNDCDAYLAAIYDASLVKVGLSRYIGEAGQYASTIAKRYNSPLAINGGGFEDPGHNSRGGNPIGVTIADGKVITNNPIYGGTYGVIGFNKDDVLVLRKGASAYTLVNEGIRDAVTMGPFLIVNGKASTMKGNGGWGYAARTAIGQRADGIVLFLVVDSNELRTKGASMKDLADIMTNYGAINAANLDGGTSSVMAEQGEIINDPIDSTLSHKTRGIPTIFMIKD